MKAVNEPKGHKSDRAGAGGAHKKATYTLPPDALTAVDLNWRFHETLDASLANSKSEYVADLIRRDAEKKTVPSKTGFAVRRKGGSTKMRKSDHDTNPVLLGFHWYGRLSPI